MKIGKIRDSGPEGGEKYRERKAYSEPQEHWMTAGAAAAAAAAERHSTDYASSSRRGTRADS